MHVLTRYMGWEAVMRIRVSRGWKITKFDGHLFIRGQDLLVVPNCHQDQTFAIQIDMEESAVDFEHPISKQNITNTAAELKSVFCSQKNRHLTNMFRLGPGERDPRSGAVRAERLAVHQQRGRAPDSRSHLGGDDHAQLQRHHWLHRCAGKRLGFVRMFRFCFLVHEKLDQKLVMN